MSPKEVDALYELVTSYLAIEREPLKPVPIGDDIALELRKYIEKHHIPPKE